MKEKSLKKNVFYNVIKMFLSLIFPMISFPYASRILMPEGIGIVNFANSIISYFSMIALLGIQAYGIREGARVRDDKEKLSKLVNELLVINFIAMAISYALLFTSLFTVPKFFPYRKLLIILSTNIIFNVIGVDWIYGALEEYRYITIRSFVFQFLSLVALFIFVKKPDDYIKYALISVCASGGSNIFNLIHSRRFITYFKIKKLELSKHLKPVFTMFGMAIASSIFTMMDTTMIGLLSTNYEVGIYSAALKGVKLVCGLISTISATLLPRVSYYLGNNETDKFNNLLEKNFNITLFLSIPATLLITCNSPLIITLLSGKNFMDSVSCIELLAMLIFFSSNSLLIDNQVLIPMKKELCNLIVLIIGAVTDLIFNLILIPHHCAFGACIGTVVAEGIMFVINFIIASKLIDIRNLFTIVKSYIPASLALALLTLVPYFLFKTSLVTTLLISIIASIIYIACLFFAKNSIVTYLFMKR